MEEIKHEHEDSQETEKFLSSDFDLFSRLRKEYCIAAQPIDNF